MIQSQKKKGLAMFPIYGCPNCGKELRKLDDGDYRCKSCKEEFDWHYIESHFGGGDVLQYGTPLFDEDEEDETPFWDIPD